MPRSARPLVPMSAAAKGGARMWEEEVLQAAGQSVAVGRVRRRRKRKLALGPHSISLPVLSLGQRRRGGGGGGGVGRRSNSTLRQSHSSIPHPSAQPSLGFGQQPPLLFSLGYFRLGDAVTSGQRFQSVYNACRYM